MQKTALATLFAMLLAQPVAGLENDYPTEARADYVFACMAVNGNSRSALSRCACSIDVIASIIPFEQYVEAETVLSLRLIGGERVGMMRTAPMANQLVDALRRAQAEAELLCF
ncbi:MAG: hypothetical protein EA339_14090 [Rhodobacteraceae bacterium]|nr:MAG: hypothetical protein EA339_14090 [Paracoccaceae bacterium]